jgi:hypothetical protein
MLLTQDRFERAIALLMQRAGEREGRRVPRVPLRGTVAVVLAAGGVPVPVNLRDVSRGGLAFTYHEALPKGRDVLVELPTSPAASEWFGCVVRHCEQIGPDMFLVGLEFAADRDAAGAPAGGDATAAAPGA